VKAKPDPPSDRSAGVSPTLQRHHHPRSHRLPHWEPDSANYFITFRLNDSLPSTVLDRIESEKTSIIRTAAQLGRDISPDERKRLTRLSTAHSEQFLDSGQVHVI
jgi:hypothetical protein